MTDARTIEAWARAHDGDTLAAQLAATGIPAPTGHEHERGEWTAAQLRDAGLPHVATDAVGNVVATLGRANDAPPVVLCAHLDTVFDTRSPIAVRTSGTRYAAPGVGDNGRGLAVMLAVARACSELAPTLPRGIRFVATVGEEGLGDLRGAKHHFGQCGPVHTSIALDGTGDDQIVTRAVASRRFRVEVDGPGGHSWSDRGMANPVHAVAQAVADLATRAAAHAGALTISRIGGGHAINAVPARAWFEADLRSTDGAAVDAMDRELRRAVEQGVTMANASRRGQSAPLAGTVHVIGDRPAGTSEPDGQAALVALAEECTRAFGSRPSRIEASTDANVPLSLGIPAVAIGGGGIGGGVHTLEEWYDNRDGWRGIARAIALTLAAAGSP